MAETIPPSVVPKRQNTMLECLIAGGIAGTAVDTVLFPLDTIKTRLQTEAGFRASGGFRGIYSGLFSAVLGSAPSASLFFLCYEYSKSILGKHSKPEYYPFVHMLSASIGETSACLVRVPTEVVKQRMQIGQYRTFSSAVSNIYWSEGALGFFKGYSNTIMREIPFACIQFPMYEYLKTIIHHYRKREAMPWEAGIAGSIAGGIAAAMTTPLDVVKTRVMVSSKNSENGHVYKGLFSSLRYIVKNEGWRALYKGIGPRVLWISIGGWIFLGVYEKAKKQLRYMEES
ncbi:hypothetical protein BB559_004052 [Furculomyces boomerangus]|uniref:Mitochondrial carrier protein PET8 n=2 Tax=Harpellales TaxID=61421 RepID=A0A2T9YH09_9FUNG|nr:hypothetical protein BB559_004052 [Furculomyces boomerangus]PWA00374.1 hypothetical protein BB558_003577 [Smittium angustum]